MSIPRDLDEAAVIDGAGPFRILWQVLVPLMKPALTTVAILQFMGHWNDFFGPFIYLNRVNMFTAAVGINFFRTAYLETSDPRDHLLMAGAATMTVPVLILFRVGAALLCVGRGDDRAQALRDALSGAQNDGYENPPYDTGPTPMYHRGEFHSSAVSLSLKRHP